MSLRDQLLKAGLANKQQAKKAARAAKKMQHKKLKAKADDPSAAQDDDDLSKEIQAKLSAQKERDKKLNEEIERQRREREKVFRAGDLIVSRDLIESSSYSQPYYFLVNEKYIHSIQVSDYQQAHLENGRMGIASPNDGRYYLLSLDDCLEVMKLAPEYVLCLHPAEEGK